MRLVEQQEAAARSSLVEALYGDDSRLRYNSAIAHTAAEHARAALRVAAPLGGATAGGSPPPPPQQHHQQQQPDDGETEPLFRWLGIVEPTPPPGLPGSSVEGHGEVSAEGDGEEDGDDDGEDVWVDPFANAEIEEEVREVIPAPSALWTPWPTGRRSRLVPVVRVRGRARPAAADPPTRRESALARFGSVRIQTEVQRWVDATTPRQEQLRRLMVSQSLV